MISCTILITSGVIGIMSFNVEEGLVSTQRGVVINLHLCHSYGNVTSVTLLEIGSYLCISPNKDDLLHYYLKIIFYIFILMKCSSTPRTTRVNVKNKHKKPFIHYNRQMFHCFTTILIK